ACNAASQIRDPPTRTGPGSAAHHFVLRSVRGTNRYRKNKTAGFRRPLQHSSSFEADHTAAVIHCCSFCFGAAPTWREAISPPLKIIRVGIDITPYFEAVFGLSSTLSLTILT